MRSVLTGSHAGVVGASRPSPLLPPPSRTVFKHSSSCSLRRVVRSGSAHTTGQPQSRRNPPHAAAAAAASSQAAAGTGAAATQGSGDNAVLRLFGAINSRDVAQLAECFEPGVEYENLAFSDSFTGATAVARFYQDSLRALPEGAEIQLEQQAGAAPAAAAAGSSSSIAVVWRLVLPSSQTTVSRGVAFFTLEPGSGRISSILDSPEHPVKLSARGLNVFGPLVQGWAESMLPAVQGLGRAVQQGVDLLLQPLEGMMAAQPDLEAGSGVVSNSSSAAFAAAAPPRPTTPAAAPLSPVPSASSSSPASRRPVAAAAAAAAEGQPLEQPNFSGLWVKVPERSDTAGYEAALDVLGLSGLQKVTARLIEGVEIQQTSKAFKVSFVTVVPFFKVTEDVPLDGGSTQLGRRDLRFGRQTTTARSIPGGVLVEMSWGAPLAGTLTEKYTLLEDGCMCVEADTRVGDKAANSKTVYKRSSGSRDQLLSESKQRNPSVAAVLQQQRSSGLDV